MHEVAAHLAAWHRFSAHRLEGLVAGELLEPPDADRFNAQARAAAARRTLDELRAEAEGARRAFLEAHDGLGAFIVEANGAHQLRRAPFGLRPRRLTAEPQPGRKVNLALGEVSER